MRLGERLSSLRSKMKEFQLEAYIIPSEDAHQVILLSVYLEDRVCLSLMLMRDTIRVSILLPLMGEGLLFPISLDPLGYALSHKVKPLYGLMDAISYKPRNNWTLNIGFYKNPRYQAFHPKKNG
jgi:hypothetical protein